MLDREQVFGRGNMKKSCALNTQHNSGVHYNWENLFFGGGGGLTSTKTTKAVGIFSQTTARTAFLLFLSVTLSSRGFFWGEIKSSIKYNLSNAFHLSAKISR